MKSEFFKPSEFRNIPPHPELISILNELRKEIKTAIIITDSARTPQEHIMIYMNKYGKNWIKHIPWNSRHLPKHGLYLLRAVDFHTSSYHNGQDLANIIQKIATTKEIKIGLGIATNWCHLDVDRKENTIWHYFDNFGLEKPING